MALSGSGKRRISPQLHARTCGQARRPLRHPGGGYSGRLHPVSAPGRRRLPPQIPGGKGMETVSSLPTMQRSAGQASAAWKAGKRPSVRSAFAIWWKTLVPIFHLCFACEVWQFFLRPNEKARLQATICGSADGLSLWNHSVSIILIFALTYMAFRKTRSRSSNVAFHAGCSENTVCST